MPENHGWPQVKNCASCKFCRLECLEGPACEALYRRKPRILQKKKPGTSTYSYLPPAPPEWCPLRRGPITIKLEGIG
jgi:hypothetical protein